MLTKPARTLFHHVLIVGINRNVLNKSHSIDNLNSNQYETRQANANGPYVLWKFPKDLVIIICNQIFKNQNMKHYFQKELKIG